MGHKATFEVIQAAVPREDFELIRGYFSDDFVLYEPEALPYGGEWAGPQGFIDLTRKIRTSYKVDVIKAELTEAGDDLLVCEYVFGFTSLRTGERLEVACVDLFRFDKNGKLLRGDAYYADYAKLAAIA